MKFLFDLFGITRACIHKDLLYIGKKLACKKLALWTLENLHGCSVNPSIVLCHMYRHTVHVQCTLNEASVTSSTKQNKYIMVMYSAVHSYLDTRKFVRKEFFSPLRFDCLTSPFQCGQEFQELVENQIIPGSSSAPVDEFLQFLKEFVETLEEFVGNFFKNSCQDMNEQYCSLPTG